MLSTNVVEAFWGELEKIAAKVNVNWKADEFLKARGIGTSHIIRRLIGRSALQGFKHTGNPTAALRVLEKNMKNIAPGKGSSKGLPSRYQFPQNAGDDAMMLNVGESGGAQGRFMLNPDKKHGGQEVSTFFHNEMTPDRSNLLSRLRAESRRGDPKAQSVLRQLEEATAAFTHEWKGKYEPSTEKEFKDYLLKRHKWWLEGDHKPAFTAKAK